VERKEEQPFGLLQKRYGYAIVMLTIAMGLVGVHIISTTVTIAIATMVTITNTMTVITVATSKTTNSLDREGYK
jgi:hypothetical protein